MHEQTRKGTILVVDDTPATRYIVSRALRNAGYLVLEAASGDEALQLVQQKPDLITLDIQLPDINGVEVCKRIKSVEAYSGIPVVHLSATYVEGKDKAHALENGADGYLTHPVEDVVLIATVKAFLRARHAEKDREQLLAKSQKDVEQLQVERDMREKFVATLTHDLRTPLTAARMSAQLILRQPAVTEKIEMQAGRIRDNIDRADQMIKDLLDANRIRAGQQIPLNLVECDLSQVAETTLADLTTMHGERFVLKSDSEVKGYWDPSTLQRIIENLASNAVKYGTPYRPVTLTIEQDPDHVSISIHNEGAELSFEEQNSLFKPYRRSASAEASQQKGWGLGLTLVRGGSEAHGGKVTVQSLAGRGTTFKIDLPRDSRPIQQNQLTSPVLA